jgi:hypothetical protein
MSRFAAPRAGRDMHGQTSSPIGESSWAPVGGPEQPTRRVPVTPSPGSSPGTLPGVGGLTHSGSRSSSSSAAAAARATMKLPV